MMKSKFNSAIDTTIFTNYANCITNLLFLLFNGFSNMVLASALEPLRVAQNLATGPDFTWETATLFDQPARSCSGLTNSPSITLAELKSADYLVLVSGYGVRQHTTPEVFFEITSASQ